LRASACRVAGLSAMASSGPSASFVDSLVAR
jgi:hypothetical protein